MERTGFWGPNVFSPVALIACYTKPGSSRWFAGVMDYIRGNLKFACEYLGQHLPKVKIIIPEATTLLWLDFNDVATTKEDLRERMLTKANVALDDGYLFGDGGEKFTRINLASPRKILHTALFFIVVVFGDVLKEKNTLEQGAPSPPGAQVITIPACPDEDIVETTMEVHINESQKNAPFPHTSLAAKK